MGWEGDVEVDTVMAPKLRHALGLLDSATCQGQMHAPMLLIPNVLGRGP
jgi:hypothetical protein